MSAGPGGGGQRLAGPWGGRGAAAVVPGGSAPPAAPPVRAGMGRGQRGDPQHPGDPPLASRRCRLGLPGRAPPAPRGGFPGAGSGLAVPGCRRAGAFPGGRRCPGDSPVGPGRRRGGRCRSSPRGAGGIGPMRWGRPRCCRGGRGAVPHPKAPGAVGRGQRGLLLARRLAVLGPCGELWGC